MTGWLILKRRVRGVEKTGDEDGILIGGGVGQTCELLELIWILPLVVKRRPPGWLPN